MLSAIIEGSLARSPMTLSAGGQEEQPWEVKSSTTARGSAWAGRMTATMAQMPSAPDQNAPDHRETKLEAIMPVMSKVTQVARYGRILSLDGHRSLTCAVHSTVQAIIQGRILPDRPI